ncbi:hypothetical protein [Kaarinaea lacus]
MLKYPEKLIDRLKLEKLDIGNLKKVIDFELQSSRDWSLSDQLGAIEVLGYTENQEALNYLKTIYRPTVVVQQGLDWREQDGVTRQEVNLIEHHYYHNTSGPLSEALHFEIQLFKGSKLHLRRLKPVYELAREYKTIYEGSIAHITIRKALDRLQESIGLHHV